MSSSQVPLAKREVLRLKGPIKKVLITRGFKCNYEPDGKDEIADFDGL